MKRPVSLLLMLGLLLAAPAFAGDVEIQVGAEVSGIYDSNIIALEDDAIDDVIARGQIRLQARDRRGDFQWSARYFPAYYKYRDASVLDDWDHDAYGEVRWQFAERWRMELSNSFVDIASAIRLEDQGLEPGPLPPADNLLNDLFQDRIQRNVANAELVFQATPRNDWRLQVQYVDTKFDQVIGFRPDIDTFVGRLGWNHVYSPRTQFGVFGRAVAQRLTNEAGGTTDTDFYNLSFSLAHRLTKTWAVNLAAGPTYVRGQVPDTDFTVTTAQFPRRLLLTDVSETIRVEGCEMLVDGTPFLSPSCGRGFPSSLVLTPEEQLALVDIGVTGPVPDLDANSLTYFATFNLTKQFRLSRLIFSYQRDISTSSSGLDQSTVVDFAEVRWIWEPKERWRFEVAANYIRREIPGERLGFVTQVGNSQVTSGLLVAESIALRSRLIGNAQVNQRYGLNAQARYRLFRHTFVFLRLFVNRSEFDRGDGFDNRDVDRFRGIVGVRHDFDPIRL